MPIIRPLLMSAGPRTVFSQTLNSNNGADEGATYRQVVALTGGAGEFSLVRVTFQASTVGAFQVDHCSIGISNGTDADTLDIPVELFTNGGASGYNIPSNGQIVSDWANLGSFDRTKSLVVVMDLTAGGTSGNAREISTGVAGATLYYLAATASYNSATTPGGFGSAVGTLEGVSMIEVR